MSLSPKQPKFVKFTAANYQTSCIQQVGFLEHTWERVEPDKWEL